MNYQLLDENYKEITSGTLDDIIFETQKLLEIQEHELAKKLEEESNQSMMEF